MILLPTYFKKTIKQFYSVRLRRHNIFNISNDNNDGNKHEYLDFTTQPGFYQCIPNFIRVGNRI